MLAAKAKRNRKIALKTEELLFILGLAASFVNLVDVMASRQTAVSLGVTSFGEIEIKSSVYYISHFAQIIFLFFAGILAFIKKNKCIGNTSHALAFLFYIIAIAIMTFRGYGFEEILSTKIVHAAGPAPLIISVVLYIFAWRADWRLHNLVFTWVGVLSTFIILINLVALPSVDRLIVESRFWGYMQVYIWVAAWFLLRPGGLGVKANIVRWGPYVIYVFVSILQQGRSRLIWAALLILAYVFVSKRRNEPIGRLAVSFIVFFLFALMVILFSEELSVGVFSEATSLLFERLDEDSRSDQFVKFFDQASPLDLLIGKGALATWSWNGVTQYGFDNWWMTALFLGGLPVVVTYFMVHGLPAWRRFKVAKGFDLVCAIIVLLWCIKLFLSETHALMLNTYLVLMCVGACLAPPGVPCKAHHNRNSMMYAR